MTAPVPAVPGESEERVRQAAAQDYRLRVCTIDGCGADLWITHTLNRPVYNADTAAELGDAKDFYTSSWVVGCVEGHVLVLPHDHAADNATFGHCDCTDDGTDVHNDLGRVMAISALGKDPR